MIVVTTSVLPDREVVECFGLVRGTTVRARHLGQHIRGMFKAYAGGEVHEYTKLVAEAREEALDRMKAEAHALGADAVLGFRFATSEVARNAAEIVAYGTAVKLRN